MPWMTATLPWSYRSFSGTHGRVEADVVVETENLLVGHPHRGAVVGVERVAVGDQGIYGVIAARELQNHQDGIFLG